MNIYKTKRVCTRQINFDINDGKLTDIEFVGGCEGNLKGIAALVKGMAVDDVILRLDSIQCESKDTSCPDQLSKALKDFKKTM
jgi:uncharacterized protein (TIGR03905 family)